MTRRFIHFITLAVLSFGTYSTPLTAADNLKSTEIKAQVGAVTVIDVRETSELKDGVIAGAWSLPTSEIKAKGARYKETLAAIPKDKDVYVYCAVGGRAARFVDELIRKGYKAHNIGGFQDLKKSGLAVQPKPAPTGPIVCREVAGQKCPG